MNENNPTVAYVVTGNGVIKLESSSSSQDEFAKIAQKLSEAIAQTSAPTQMNPIQAPTQASVIPANPNDLLKSNGFFAAVPDVGVSNGIGLAQSHGGTKSATACGLFDDIDPSSVDAQIAAEERIEITDAINESFTVESFDDIIEDEQDATVIAQADQSASDIPSDDDEDDEIEAYIKNSGYISNNGLWRRWVMAQMLRHYNKADGTSGFDEYFVTGTPYTYQWHVALNELKVLKHLRGKALTDRERFFNMSVIMDMCRDYEKKIESLIDKSEKRRDANFKTVQPCDRKRCMYTYVPGYKGRIYMADNAILPKTKKAITKSEFMAKVQKYTKAVYLSRSYYEMIKAVETFTKHCPLVKTLAKAAAWKNAFKGTGAYYTMDNMIKFHGCKFTVEDDNGNKTILDMDKSLRYLEMKTADYQNEYYRLYALMRKFIEDNNFTYSDTPVDEYELKNYG